MFVTVFFTLMVMIPIYGLLIWMYICPEESILFGRRWMYKEEPKVSNKAIRDTKFSAMTVMIGLPFVWFSIFLEIYLLRFSLVILPLVIIIGRLKIFSDDKD
jgi:hypothetical protein